VTAASTEAPATAGASGPKHAVATENGRYYTDPKTGASLISVTNVLSAAVVKWGLMPWQAKLIAEYAVDNHQRIAELAESDREAILKELKGQADGVRDRAADLGSRVHKRAEATVLRAPYADDPEVEPFADQLVKWFAAERIDLDRHIEAAETTVAHRSLGYAGTTDLFVWLLLGPDGRRSRKRYLWLVDYKTSSTRPVGSTYPEQPMQLGAYRHGEVVWLPDGTEFPVPKVAGTAILNLRAKSHALIPVPGDREAFRAFRGALDTARYLYAAPKSFPAAAPVAPFKES
jgi:hypothetical protein